MANASLLSPRLIALKEAMGPVARSFRSRKETAPPRTEDVGDMIYFVSDHLDRIADWWGDFDEEINCRLGPAVTDHDANDAEVRRAVSSLDARLEWLMDDWDDVRNAEPDPTDERAWKLLTDLYRDIVAQVQEWLDELVEVLDDPLAATEKRGLADEKTAHITLSLTFRRPSQTKALARWAEERTIESERAARKKANRESWIAGILIGIGLGFLLGGDGDG